MRPEGGRDGGRGRRNDCIVPRLARRKRGGMRQRGRREGMRQITISIHPPNASFNVSGELMVFWL